MTCAAATLCIDKRGDYHRVWRLSHGGSPLDLSGWSSLTAEFWLAGADSAAITLSEVTTLSQGVRRLAPMADGGLDVRIRKATLAAVPDGTGDTLSLLMTLKGVNESGEEEVIVSATGCCAGDYALTVERPDVAAAVDLDFIASSYRHGLARTTALTDLTSATFTRASAGMAQNAAGTWLNFASGVPRITDQGLLVEEPRTNGIRNSALAGAVVGDPGTLPTNVTAFAPTGVTTEVVATGTALGLAYVDVRFKGTAGASGFIQLYADSATAIVAAPGQTWSASVFAALVAGALPSGVGSLGVQISEHTAAGAFVTAGPVTGSVSGDLARLSATRTLGGGTTARVRMNVSSAAQVTNGASVDVTIRIAAPQLEQGAFATSPIITTGAAATRAGDRLTIAGPFGAAAGTLFFHGSRYDNSTSGHLVGVSDGTFDNEADMNILAATTPVWGRVRSRGAAVATVSGAATPTSVFKAALAWSLNDVALVVAGGTPATDTTADPPVSANVLSVGGASFFDGQHLNGYIRGASLWQRRLSNADLQTRTAA